MQLTVGVLRGGPSSEHEVSLTTGKAVLNSLPHPLIARDIYIDKKGQWHDRGKAMPMERILRQLDLAFIGLHGEFGEDGKVQKILEQFGIPYTGSEALGSHFAMHKLLSKMRAKEEGLLVPEFLLIEREKDIEKKCAEAIRTFHPPVVIKPLNGGSSIGTAVARSYQDLVAAAREIYAQGAAGVLIEEYIRGKEAVVDLIEDFRGEKLCALPVVEVLVPRDGVFRYEAKHLLPGQYVCPAHFSRVETEDLKRAAKLMHRALGLRHYSQSDFILTKKGIYYLESNSLPGLTEHSLLPKALTAVGMRFPDFLSHVILLALGKTGRALTLE
jgi:D-alanine-D-alanine ligase